MLKRFLAARFQAFLDLPAYFRDAKSQWQEFAFGGSLVALVMGSWAALGTVPTKVWIAVFFLALFVAGYHTWRGEYLRTQPRIRLRKATFQITHAADRRLQMAYVQVIPECLGEMDVEGCKGFLRSVQRFATDKSRWVQTEINEPIDLVWSMIDQPVITLRPRLERRLNICRSLSTGEVETTGVMLPVRYKGQLNLLDRFRLDIMVTPKGGPAATVILELTFNGRWDTPSITVL